MANGVVENLINEVRRHLGNVISIELALTKRGLSENREIFREITEEIAEIKKYKQWIEKIDEEFNKIDNNFKQIMGECANKYHKLLEELKRKGWGNSDLYESVMNMYGIFEFLHKNGLSSYKLLIIKFQNIFTELNRIKMRIGNNRDLHSLFVRYHGEISSTIRKKLDENVINKIIEIDNNIKNLINRIKKIYGHLSSLSRMKNYENIYKEIVKGEKELHEEIVKLEKLHEEIKDLNIILVNFGKQINLNL